MSDVPREAATHEAIRLLAAADPNHVAETNHVPDTNHVAYTNHVADTNHVGFELASRPRTVSGPPTMSSSSVTEWARPATHAGSWYSDNKEELSNQLDGWLGEVPMQTPEEHARVIIAPHAGYAYSGRTAAFAYKALNLTGVKRVFLLGPSHHKYLSDCALTQLTHYITPLGDVVIDREATEVLYATRKFSAMTRKTDEDEHSIELHLPYIYKLFSRAFGEEANHPKLVPMLVGNTNETKEKEYAEILAPYLADPTNAFIISSDFCHWGSRFSYTYYLPAGVGAGDGHSLPASRRGELDPPIYESIERLDRFCMNAIAHTGHESFLNIIDKTGNTVCGRHPIGIMLATMDVLKREGRMHSLDSGFTFVKYARSSDCRTVRDSSVSYASAYAKVGCEHDVFTEHEELQRELDADHVAAADGRDMTSSYGVESRNG